MATDESATNAQSDASSTLSRDALPIPDQPYAGPVYYDAKGPAAVYPPIQEIRPHGAPISPDMKAASQ